MKIMITRRATETAERPLDTKDLKSLLNCITQICFSYCCCPLKTNVLKQYPSQYRSNGGAAKKKKKKDQLLILKQASLIVDFQA